MKYLWWSDGKIKQSKQTQKLTFKQSTAQSRRRISTPQIIVTYQKFYHILHPKITANRIYMKQTETRSPRYLDYLNNFWREDEAEHFTPVQSRLFFLLLSIFNRKHWCNEVAISDGALCDMVGVSLNTLKRAKAELIERGIITLTRGGRGFATKTRYQLRCEDRGQSRSQSSCQNLTPLYNERIKDNKTKNYNGERKGFNTTQSDFD